MPIPDEVRAEVEPALTAFCDKHSSAAGADPLRYTYEFEANAAGRAELT